MKSDMLIGLESAGWPVLLVEDTGVICQANLAAQRLFGPALAGEAPKLASVWSPENQTGAVPFLAQRERTPALATPLKFQGAGGQSLSFLTLVNRLAKEGRTYHVLQLLSEVLLPAKASAGEPSLAQKQKLDCALQLARTVALDFNNALTSILGHSSLLLSQMEPNHPWRRSLLEVEKSAAKAAEIASDLGTFSRQEKETRPQAAGNLNQLLQRTVETFQHNPGSQPVEWVLQPERKLFGAKFDEAKMQQAFLKILENALEALPGGGRITVLTRNLELTEPTQDRNVQLVAGAYVCAEISDNGGGIAPEVLPRIFEPFFTTKRNHRGLGLAWVYGIVTNHGGGVAVSSQVNAGTSVRVYLPAQANIVKESAPQTDNLKGEQSILMVDDEDLLLTMGQTILSAYGYRVLVANSGQKALDLLAEQKQRVDLVITDLVMPAMGGRELVEHIQRLSPETRILCTSGYVWPAGQETERAYLQKPFTSQDLLVKVKQVLAEPN